MIPTMNPNALSNRHGEHLDAALHAGTRPNCLVLLGHGVTGNKDRPLIAGVAEKLADLGWPCLRFSFSGNGESEGDFRDATPSKESADLLDIIRQIPETTQIAYIGHSMGGAVGLLAACKTPRIKVLVTLAGMVHTKQFLDTEFGDVTPDKGFMWDEQDCPLSRQFVDDMTTLDTLTDQAAAINRPYLLIHGTADDVVLPADSEAAYGVAPEPKKLVSIEGASHMFEETGYDDAVKAIHSWLETYLP